LYIVRVCFTIAQLVEHCGQGFDSQ